LKILCLTSRFPYPLEKGDKLRIFHQIVGLSANHDIYLIAITDKAHTKTELEMLAPYTKGLYVIRISPLERFISLFKALFSGLPFQTAWFYSSNVHKQINRIISDIQPDHIYCQLARMAEYAIHQPFKKTLDYMDCFGKSMSKRAKVAKGINAWIHKIEAKRMMTYEEEIASKFDHLTIISQQDKEQFEFAKAKDIKVIPNGIGNYFNITKSPTPKTYQFVFVGNMSYLPNVETVEYIVSQILPLCPSDYKLLIAGANPNSRVKALENSNVSVSGWIEDIRDAYLSGKIFLAPMWSGTGQQNKILEAMALGVPCITTQIVNNAIGATHLEEILIADTKDEFLKMIQLLDGDQKLYDKISINSRSFVKQNFDWNQSISGLNRIFALN
jgi:polysaccharide biosynthesis protein PslH